MTVSVYAKNSVPDLSYVEANSTMVSLYLKFSNFNLGKSAYFYLQGRDNTRLFFE